MTTPDAKSSSTQPPSSSQQQARTTYISSNGQPLTTPPLNARISRAGSNIYNFLGLYFVSLFSLDPYTAAQNSQFNTRGPAGRGTTTTMGAGAARWGAGGVAGSRGTGSGGGGGGGVGGAGSGGSGRRLGTVDDVRGPECGSCG